MNNNNNNNINNNNDNWLTNAFDDVTLVANILLNLRYSSPSSLPKTWTTRQPRSRPPPTTATNAVTVKKPSSTRASPTTPLSWSGGAATSVSGGGGVEETSADVSKSKVIRANETTLTKRPRKKKTLTELKEDEMTLLKERKQLKRQLATLQATCQKQRNENESLKKMKNDMKQRQALVVSNCTAEQKNDSFVIPDLNIPAGEEC